MSIFSLRRTNISIPPYCINQYIFIRVVTLRNLNPMSIYDILHYLLKQHAMRRIIF